MWKSVLVAVGLCVASVSAGVTPQVIRYRRGPGVNQDCEPTPDPNPFEPANVNLSLNPIIQIDEGSSHQGGLMEGGSQAEIDIGIIIITMQITFNLWVPTLDINANGVQATGYVDTRPLASLPNGNFTGSGDNGMARLRTVRIRGNAAIFINIIGNKVGIRELTLLELTFGDICLDLGAGFQIGGSTVDWTDFCDNFKSRFDAEWADAGTKNEAIEKIRVAANIFVGQYTLDELVDLIGGGGDGCTEAPKIY